MWSKGTTQAPPEACLLGSPAVGSPEKVSLSAETIHLLVV